MYESRGAHGSIYFFNSLACYERLKEAGVPEAQARIQAEIMRSFAEEQYALIQKKTEAIRQESVTSAYLDMRLKELELKLVKWQSGIGVALALIMAKGFNWLGF